MGSNTIHKRVVVFFWDGWLSISPSIINTLLLLHKNGYEVDCITRFSHHELAEDIDFPEGISIYRCGEIPKPATSKEADVPLPLKNKNLIYNTFKKLFGFYKGSYTSKRNFQILFDFIEYIRFSRKIISGKHYSFVIGVDTNGLVASGILFFFKNPPLIYYSLEIRFISDFKYLVERQIKHFEKYFHRKAHFTIIQDKYRYAALCKENNVVIASSTFFIVPNGPMGNYQKIQSDYFQQLFQFSDDAIIVLHAGGLSSGYMNDEIARSCVSWPENIKLVFHFSGYYETDSDAIQLLRDLSHNKAYFSTTPVPFDKLAQITSSAHIGIAFYNKDRGLNHSLIVGASGKMANYFRCGIPVIALNLPGFQELFDQYGCGVVIESPDDCEDAISTILKDYEEFSSNASRCYDEVYEFEKHFNAVLEKMNV